ncbi:ABC transporter ATP-binding protein [Mycolicibacterium sp. 018/SC-01/001]|uniref:ABC transporter ATP-binding protein n=1 Tax=Mycolicibacterium sp. 018/SC-01/001 TaxID=2592069 RepID=UPI00117EA77B|nr:ABC transporter ATP-binding protein [Mycolicibacterium sp. 018/SC-01/001]TRW86287.1 ABC transporter ATP-binding protein [Mycolicibacterium sp. 018/SC-01/001]
MSALADHDVHVDTTPVLEVDRLSVEVRTISGTLRAVNEVSFGARRGETLALLGESGCGKSMTATALVGLLEPVADIVGGSARLAHQGGTVDLVTADRKKRRAMAGTELAIVFQDALTALNPLYTVGTQLAEPFQIHNGLSAKEAKSKALELMARVGIPQPETRMNSYPHQFSGGMRQRLLIAMAVALNPSVLIADEPTTALDVTVQAQIMALLRDLRTEYNMAVVLITHDLALVAEEADRVAVMYAGNIVETGSVAEVFANPRHPYTKGLLNSVPVNARRGDSLKSIGGSPPDLHAVPAGCVYQARCPLARDICTTTRPILSGTDRATACHFPEEVTNV